MLFTVYVLRDVRVDISALQTVVYPWLVRDLLGLCSRISCRVERSTNTADEQNKSLVKNT